MYTINDIRVNLLNAEEVRDYIRRHGQVACICYATDEKFAEKVGVACMKDGHFSGSRGDFFKFEIECPRFTADQSMRHEIGVFKNCQSQRYVDMDDNFSIYVPPKVMNDPVLKEEYQKVEDMLKARYKALRACYNDMGITGEQANDLMRTLLPIGVKTKLRIGFTIEALSHFMQKRLCARADAPIRRVAQLMRAQVLAVEPRYEELLKPQCEVLGYCPEKHGCGKAMTVEEFHNVLAKAKEEREKDSRTGKWHRSAERWL